MYTKCALAFFLAAVVFVTYAPPQAYAYGYAAAPNKSHNMIAGSRIPGDRLVHREYVIKSSSLWQITSIQKIFRAPKFERITQVVALDLSANGTGAYASIVKGGPGMNNVTMKFKSQRNHGIKFQVEIYSRR
ncbi:probable salivary secreted peptide [Diachasma alloeum]|uniref:probable salivary secreted peptide n=1 Tax=Diachasma alloeum TaxID=454923 RepID=UPI00073834B8|nr:probable salivary secreted peptide [Diachasma alloeum]